MSNRLYVGNLNWDTTSEGLSSWFAKCGTVDDAKVMMDRDSGRSRGFGFVTMSSEDEAQRAIAELNGKVLDGRPLKVNEAQERAPRNPDFQDRQNRQDPYPQAKSFIIPSTYQDQGERRHRGGGRGGRKNKSGDRGYR